MACTKFSDKVRVPVGGSESLSKAGPAARPAPTRRPIDPTSLIPIESTDKKVDDDVEDDDAGDDDDDDDDDDDNNG